MVVVGAAAMAAAAAWIVILLSPASERPDHSSTRDTAENGSITTLAGASNRIPAEALAAGRSMVELRATTSHGPVTLIGVAVAEGGFVVTTADALEGSQGVALVGPGGKLERASVVALDHSSDVALVNVPEAVPVAPFADDSNLAPGAPDLALTLVPAGSSTLALHGTPGSVTAVGAAIGGGSALGMPCITSAPAPNEPAAPAPAATEGEPLLNASGSVMGILYGPGSTAATTFLPTQLVVGVADDLRSASKVVHGWLGVDGGDVTGGTGAVVQTVNASGPAAGRLRSGDVILAVNSAPVRTMAELRARLYVMAPGTTVGVSVQEGGATRVVNLTLGGSS
jgi:S1-C subfamily serine protease